MAILTSQDRQRIEAAIAALEQRSAAEIVVAEIARSDSYLDVRLALSGLFALGASAFVHMLLPVAGVGELLGLELLLFALGFLLFSTPALLRSVLLRGRADAAVTRAAALSFLEHGVFATRDRTGVLILLSELERKVTILGDKGIHARVANQGWDAHVDTMVKAIRAGKAGDGVCQVIDALGTTLAELAPVRSDDTNELSNKVR
jgi:putative membrane protein